MKTSNKNGEKPTPTPVFKTMQNSKNGKKLPHYGERVAENWPFPMGDMYRVFDFTVGIWAAVVIFAKFRILVGIP